jgi:hypothetical protein
MYADNFSNEELEQMLQEALERGQRMGIGITPPDLLTVRERREHKRQTARIMLLERRIMRRSRWADLLAG